jgi:hypothetical protein
MKIRLRGLTHSERSLATAITVSQIRIMTRKILTALVALGFTLIVYPSSHSAQERQIGDRPAIENRSQENRTVMDIGEVEKLRRDLVAAYEESEALIRFLAGYKFLRQSDPMKDYESVCQSLANERLRLEQLSAAELATQTEKWPYARTLDRFVQLSRSIRTDATFQAAIQKAERHFNAEQSGRNSSIAKTMNSRGVIAAPSYIPPACNFDDPSTYPSGVDLGIAKAVSLALHTAVEAQPSEFMVFCVMIPNPIRIAFAIAAGIADQVLNALEAVAADAAYCETIRLYVEEQLTGSGGGIPAILIDDDYYLTFTYKSVKAALLKATGTGVPTNCGNTRFTEASAFFDGSGNFTGTGPQRVNAYRLLRLAYNNIGASACVQ